MSKGEARVGKLISFDENGEAYFSGVNVAETRAFSKRQLNAMYAASLALPYEKKKDSDGFIEPGEETFEGMTMGEAMYYRLARAASWGDMDAIKLMGDRTLGKPKQELEVSGKIELTCTEYLEQLASIEAATPVAMIENQTEILDVTVETTQKIDIRSLGV